MGRSSGGGGGAFVVQVALHAMRTDYVLRDCDCAPLYILVHRVRACPTRVMPLCRRHPGPLGTTLTRPTVGSAVTIAPSLLSQLYIIAGTFLLSHQPAS